MTEYIHWPAGVLPPAEVNAAQCAFTRSGGRSLGGIERSTRTDRGFWQIMLEQIPVYSSAQLRVWGAVRTELAGRAGLIAVPVWSFKTAPWPDGIYEPPVVTLHDDGTPFDDGTGYASGVIDIEMASFAPIGATVVTLRLINGSTTSGIRFSYQHALYETGSIIDEPGAGLFQVSIFPAIRCAIPEDARLEVDVPTCLCHLMDDRGMDILTGITPLVRQSVSFVEAVDFWNALALEDAA